VSVAGGGDTVAALNDTGVTGDSPMSRPPGRLPRVDGGQDAAGVAALG
jgi:hypothetical protein